MAASFSQHYLQLIREAKLEKASKVPSRDSSGLEAWLPKEKTVFEITFLSDLEPFFGVNRAKTSKVD